MGLPRVGVRVRVGVWTGVTLPRQEDIALMTVKGFQLSTVGGLVYVVERTFAVVYKAAWALVSMVIQAGRAGVMPLVLLYSP